MAKSKSKKNSKLMRTLAGLGGVISLIFFIVGMVVAVVTDLGNILYPIIFGLLGVLVDIILLNSLNMLKGIINVKIKISWLTLLIFGILDAVFRYYGGLMSYGYLGTLLIIIAVIIGIFDDL